MTTAQTVAALLGEDGTRRETRDGRTLGDLCRSHDATEETTSDGTRYVFADGSTLIATPGGWDLGLPGADCWCWQGQGHRQGCEEEAR